MHLAKTWPGHPDQIWASFAQYDPGLLWKKGTELDMGSQIRHMQSSPILTGHMHAGDTRVRSVVSQAWASRCFRYACLWEVMINTVYWRWCLSILILATKFTVLFQNVKFDVSASCSRQREPQVDCPLHPVPHLNGWQSQVHVHVHWLHSYCECRAWIFLRERDWCSWNEGKNGLE